MQGLQAWLDSARVTSLHMNQYAEVRAVQVIFPQKLRLRADAVQQLACLKLSDTTLVLESPAHNSSSGDLPLSATASLLPHHISPRPTKHQQGRKW
jgi:hypothetical protein